MLEYVDDSMPAETALAFGLHPNAEIGFRLREAESFCNSLVQLQPREAGGEGGMSTEEKAKMVLDDLVSADLVNCVAARSVCSVPCVCLKEHGVEGQDRAQLPGACTY